MLNAIPGTLPKLARSWSLLLEEVFSICDGLRMTKNSVIPGTLPNLARSWCLLLEEVFSICSWASLSLATTLKLVWQVVAQARLM